MNNILDNELFEAFANSADNIFIYVSDMRNNLTRWSTGAVNLFGIEEYQKDTSSKWLEYVHPDDRDAYLTDISAVFNGEKKQHNCQYRAQTKYGEYVWVECRGSVIYDGDTPSVFAGIMTRLDNQNKYDNLTHLLTGSELTRYPFNEAGALMFVGIDEFRKINSRYGLLYGNKVLTYLADTLISESGDAVVYRFQGDEFAVLGKDMSSVDMIDIFKKVQELCGKSGERDNIIDFSLSAGIVEFENVGSCVEPLANVELSLSYAKQDINHYVVYSDEIKNKQIRRDLVSEVLLKSLKDNNRGFRLVYQPILANSGDSIVACEALCRWDPMDERIGRCFPDEFIAILESNGGINDLGYFVMREAIRQASVWQKKYRRFNVSFNVSYVQLEDPSFVPAILSAIDEFGADPTGIVVELTESVLDVDTVMLKNSFELLKGKGIRIALDDFGTGNSSFWMLHNIDVDIVKLDQSFIRGLDTTGKGIDYAIVESVGLMCNRIGCQTVAEGVETNDIWKLISGFEFTGLQGYLFSKPVEVSEFEDILEKYGMK